MTHRWQEFRVAPDRENSATVVIVGLVVVVALATTLGGLAGLFHVGTDPGIRFQYWRLATYAFTSFGLLQAAINALVLWFMVRGLEVELGPRLLVTWFVLTGLGAATAHILAGPASALNGAMGSMFGLIAAYAVLKHKARMDIRPDIFLLGLFLVWGIVSGSMSWIGNIGGIVVGTSLGAVQAYSPWRNRRQRVTVLTVGVAVACVLLVTLRWMGIA